MQSAQKKNEYMRKWYAEKVKNDPDWTNKKREQTRKSVAAYYKKTGYKNGTQKAYYERHKNEPEFKRRKNEAGLISFHKHKEKHKEKRQKQKKKFRDTNPEYDMFMRAKARAKQYILEFNIEEKDIVIPEYCPVLGIKLEKVNGRWKDCSPSLDRLDNSKGYIKGNILVMSMFANAMKNKATPEQIMAFSKWGLSTYA